MQGWWGLNFGIKNLDSFKNIFLKYCKVVLLFLKSFFSYLALYIITSKQRFVYSAESRLILSEVTSLHY